MLFRSFSSLTSPLDFADASKFQLSTFWWGGGAYASRANVEDTVSTVRASLGRDLELGIVDRFDAGVIYSRRKKEIQDAGFDYALANGSDCNMVFCAPLPSGSPSTVSLGASHSGHLLYFDMMSMLGSGAYMRSPSAGRDLRWNWSVEEHNATAFAKLGFEFDALIPWHGNVGAQMIYSRQESGGLYQDANGDQNPVNGDDNYSNLLPSVMLIGDLDDATKLRIGFAQSVARPEMEAMRAGIDASVSATDHLWSGSGGNPKLRPWRSYDADISLEHYFGIRSYVALAGFYKDFQSAIVTKDVVFDFAGYTNPSGVVPVSDLGTLDTPTNVRGGWVRGVELSGTQIGRAHV